MKKRTTSKFTGKEILNIHIFNMIQFSFISTPQSPHGVVRERP